MIDARLVGGFLLLFTVVLIPVMRWLGGLAVQQAFGKVTTLEAQVAQVSAKQEALNGRQDDHGRKLALAANVADHAYNKAAGIEPRVSELEISTGRLEGRVDRAEKDIDKIDEKVQDHLVHAKAG